MKCCFFFKFNFICRHLDETHIVCEGKVMTVMWCDSGGVNWGGCSNPWFGCLRDADALSSGRVFPSPLMQLGTKRVFLSCLLLWKLFCSCKLPLRYTQVLQLVRNFLCFTKIRLCLPPSQHPKWLAVPVNPSLWILWRPLTARGDCVLPECFLSRRKSMHQGGLCLTSINYTVPLHLMQ